MSLPVILSPEAEEDAEQARDQLEQQRPTTGAKFLARLRDVLDHIEAMPQMYAPIWQQVRAARLRRYPFVVYYRVLPDRVEVLAVMHGSRDWPAWQSRV
jgi:toxin ParE1/3/4